MSRFDPAATGQHPGRRESLVIPASSDTRQSMPKSGDAEDATADESRAWVKIEAESLAKPWRHSYVISFDGPTLARIRL